MASVRRTQGVRPARVVSAGAAHPVPRAAQRTVSASHAEGRRGGEANMKVVVRIRYVCFSRRGTAAENAQVLQTTGPRGTQVLSLIHI